MGLMKPPDQLMSAARACRSKQEAQKLVRQEIAAMMFDYPSLFEETARDMLLKNIGYSSADLGVEEGNRLLELFDTEHPYLGKTITSDQTEIKRLVAEAYQRKRATLDNTGDVFA